MAQIEDMWVTPGPQPNGLQATSDGLWVIDQTDNHLYKLSYTDGSVIEKLPTETVHSSGVTEGGGHLWVASTYSCELFKLDFKGGAGHRRPRHGVDRRRQHVGRGAAGPEGLSHGPQDDDGEARNSLARRSSPRAVHARWLYWLADTGIGKVHRLDPEDGRVLGEIDVPAPEVHGMTLHKGSIWFCCAATRRVCTVALPV